MTHPGLKRAWKKRPLEKPQVQANTPPKEGATITVTDRERAMSDRYRKLIPADQLLELPVISVAAILKMSEESPYGAAFRCGDGFRLLEIGHQRQLRHYIGAAYVVTVRLRDNDKELEQFSSFVYDGRSKNSLSVGKVKANLLHYVFRFIFAERGGATRNRAFQYAYGLQDSYNLGRSIEEVGDRIVKYGPEKLYRAAAKRKHLLEAAQECEAAGRDPATITEDEVLADMAEDSSGELIDDYGSRELPPDDEADCNELEPIPNDSVPEDDDETRSEVAGEGESDDDELIFNDEDYGDDDDDGGEYYNETDEHDNAEREALVAVEDRLLHLEKLAVAFQVALGEVKALIMF